MAGTRQKLSDYLIYLAFRVVVMFLHMFDWRSVYRLAGSAGDLWYRLDKRHRARAAEHLRRSFPAWTDRRIQRTVRGSFRNMAYLAIEVVLTTKLVTYWRWQQHIVLAEMSNILRRLMSSDSAAILICGHFGGWEVAGYTLAALGFEGYAIARPLDNPHLNDYLMGVRQNMGLKILDKTGAAKRMRSILQAGHYIAFIADQDAGPRGVFVDFFGTKASTYKAPALMAMEYDLPLAVGYGRRMGEQYRFEIGVERFIEPSEWADKPDPIAWITQEYTAALEAVIRKDPQQYLWTYRRWKTRPRGERVNAQNPAPLTAEAS